MADTPALPLWRTIKDSYRLAWKYRNEYFKIAWCWWLAAAVVTFGSKLISPPQEDERLICPPEVVHTIKSDLLDFLTCTALIFFASSIAVAWHRLILRHEKAAVTFPYLRSILPYFFIALSLYVLYFPDNALTPLLMDFILFQTNHYPSAWEFFTILIIMWVVITQIQVVLPAKALRVKNITFKGFFNKTIRNFWKLSLGSFLCILPFLLLLLGLIFFLSPLLDRPCDPGFEETNIYYLTFEKLYYMIVIAPVYLTFLSLAYQHIFEKDATKQA